MRIYSLGFVVLLSGCSLLPDPEDAVEKYVLDSVSSDAFGGTKSKAALKKPLLIEMPTVSAPLDNGRVAIRPTSSTIDYIANIEWADRLGALIHESMIQSAQNSGFFQAVGRMNSGIQSQHLLLTDVRKFHQNLLENKVEVEYFAQVMDVQGRKVIASKSFMAEGSVLKKSPSAVALALEKAHQSVSIDLLTWVAKAAQ